VKRPPVVAVCLCFFSLGFPTLLFGQEDLFPLPEAYRPNVDFWEKIYSVTTTSQGLLHDAEDLSLVFAELDFSKTPPRGSRARYLKTEKARLVSALERLAERLDTPELTPEEQALRRVFEPRLERDRVLGAAKNLRFQLGQKDKFVRGVAVYLRLENTLRTIFRAEGVPEDLSFLPQVESSFNVYAYSKFGAAGMWQFMLSTGRLFLHIDPVLDERLDIEISTRAAARLLKHNFDVLGAWPLAITAYNHGLNGMKRAKAEHGEFQDVFTGYRSRAFGFASRNFYAEFLAARRIMQNHERYFGPIAPEPEPELTTLVLPDFIAAGDLAAGLGVSVEELEHHNPSLRDPVWKSDKYVPRGFSLKIPARSGIDYRTRYAGIAAAAKKNAQRPTTLYVVKKGDTLSSIARKHGVPAKRIAQLNSLRGSRIYRNQRLRLPSTEVVVLASPPLVAQAPVPASRPSTAPSTEDTYVVRRGDNLTDIARRQGVDLAVLRELNALQGSRILPGQRLVLRRAEVVASAPPEAPRGAKERWLVRKGDTLTAVARATGLPLDTLRRLNDLRGDRLLVGQVLRLREVPPATVVALAPAPAPSETPRPTEPAVPEGKAEPSPVPAAPPPVPAPGETSPVGQDTAAPPETPVLEAEGGEGEAPGDVTLTAAAAPEPVEELVGAAWVPPEPAGTVPEEPPPAPPVLDAPAVVTPAIAVTPPVETFPIEVITVEAEETLGHLAEWLGVRAADLRRLNGLRFNQDLGLNQRLRIEFSRVDREEFLQRRNEYHKMIEDDFNRAYRIGEVLQHTVARGETLWSLCHKKFQLPLWLLVGHNPNRDLSKLAAGDVINIPMIEELNAQERGGH